MNVALSSRHTVHATAGGNTPKCLNFGHKGSESYRTTTREVSCKKCLKQLATEAEAEAAYQDRLAASMAPSTDFHATPEDAEQPAEIREIRETAEAKAAELWDDLRNIRELLAGEVPADAQTALPSRALADPFATEAAPVVAELNGRAAVWMVLHQGRQMWAAKNAPGLYVSKDRAVAAQRRATAATRRDTPATATVRRAINFRW